MEISNPQTLDHIIEANGKVMRFKIIDIPPWDMDTDISITFAHGLVMANIVAVSVQIRRDDGNFYYDLAATTKMAAVGETKRIQVGATDIQLNRLTGGFFDSVQFGVTVFGRGRCVVSYID